MEYRCRSVTLCARARLSRSLSELLSSLLSDSRDSFLLRRRIAFFEFLFPRDFLRSERKERRGQSFVCVAELAFRERGSP
jgi:hypothetical protein